MAKLNERQIEYLHDPIFLRKYINILNNRLVYSNNKIEEEGNSLDQLYDNAHILSLEDNFNAFNILIRKLLSKDNELTEDLIIKVANTINKHAMYISDNYRTIGEGVKFKNKYPIESPQNIKQKMQELLQKYYGPWSKLDIFEREALFNIEFLRIHPFEDGNGRTSRLILNYNLLRNGHAPILIPSTIREKYFEARNTENVKWIKDMFEDESRKELIALNSLIEAYEKESTSIKNKKNR